MEQVLEQFRQRIAARAPLRIQGGGTKQWHGRPVQGETLDTRAYAGIIDYDPSELVISARCGTPLAEIEAALAAQGQMLGFEPPRMDGATLGGMFASGLSGPRRMQAGAVRDFTLGATLMDGEGQVLRFGGRVIKNVAGYDVSRLLAGSLGTLGLVLEVSLKVVPAPAGEATLQFSLSQAEALQRLANWGGRPLPLSASCWFDGVLTIRLSGAQAAVQAACRDLGGEPLAEAADFWSALRDLRHAFFNEAGGAPLWRLALPPTAAPLPGSLPGAGRQLVEWSGGQRWLRSAADAAEVRALAAGMGGHATLWGGGDDVFHPLAAHVAVLHRRLKAAFDPAAIFNPGRMYRDH